MDSPDFIDNFLDFGHYVFGTGKAYPSSIYNMLTPGSVVAKNFVASSGRTFLIEDIRFSDLIGPLEALPPVQVKTTSFQPLPGAKRMKVAAVSLPQLQPTKSEVKPKLPPAKLTASVSIPQGVTIDYIATVSSLNEPTLYTSDTTYFVTNTVYLTSPVTMESAVFKFPTNSSGELMVEGSLTMATTNYRPAIFTSADDNNAGATLSTNIWSNYSGNPGNPAGSVALCFETSDNIVINNLKFTYIYYALGLPSFTSGQTFSISHTQIWGTTVGMLIVGQSGSATENLTLNNCLIHSVGFPIQANSITNLTLTGYNCTIYGFTTLFGMYSSTGSMNFTNSIFSSPGSMGSWSPMTLNGGYNGFYSLSPSFGTSAYPIPSSPFATSGAGYCYISPGNALLTNGTTNIPPALLSQLAMKTSLAPTALASPQFTMDTTLSPTVQRDTSGTAMGFQYDPLDYYGTCEVSNATLTIAPGVALGYFANFFFWLQSGSHLVCQGTPTQRNYVAHYNAVQEVSTMLWYGGTMAQMLPFTSTQAVSPGYPTVDLRLTTICAPTGETNLWRTTDNTSGNYCIGSLTLQDCEVYGSGANWVMNENANMPIVGFTNNVFYRVPFAVNSNAKITSYNNLFYGTTNTNEFTISMAYRAGAPSPNTHENNVFDGVQATLDGTVGYNAYVNGATNTSFTNNNDIITNIAWQGGPLGEYYQTTNSPLLTNGSTFATNLGLYHYTVMTNAMSLEGTNIVSRGYHYVGLGTNGLPIDTNGDGIPDYLEDANGNGVPDSGEINWQVAGDMGLNVIITQPANNSTIP